MLQAESQAVAPTRHASRDTSHARVRAACDLGFAARLVSDQVFQPGTLAGLPTAVVGRPVTRVYALARTRVNRSLACMERTKVSMGGGLGSGTAVGRVRVVPTS